MTQFETVVFGGGCFWCTEAIFKHLKGVLNITPGYAGGTTSNPNYYNVCSGKTGHAEVIKIDFDPAVIPYKDLLDIFWNTHNPTTPNRQDFDTGSEYRSIILYTTEQQKEETLKSLFNLKNSGLYKDPIVTEIKPLDKFYEAESYNKDYYEKNQFEPYCQIIISPKLAKLRDKYKNKLKDVDNEYK